MRCCVESIGIVGPGLNGWNASREVFNGAQPHLSSAPPMPKLDLLPATERRRTSTTVKYALTAGADALAGTSRAARDIATVFAASSGDGEVLHEICATLASSERQVSPMKFHNSVHNAAAGYWSIATGAQIASSSVCAYDWSFAAGLLEAVAQVNTGCDAMLLIVADVAYPEPLRTARPINDSFACALLLSTYSATSLCTLEVRFEVGARAASVMENTSLEALRKDNPSARALPLLAAIARRDRVRLTFDYLHDASVSVDVLPNGEGNGQ